MTSHSAGYVLLTAVKNESAMLDGLFESVTSQTLKPRLWVLAEDGSNDDSLAKARALAASHPWIVVVTRQGTNEYPWLKYASAIRFALEGANREMMSRGIEPAMIGVLDADTVVEPDYFEKLMAFDDFQKVGIASGLIATEGGGELESRPMARACARLYGARFLSDVAGFPHDAAYDTVMEVKARNRGYAFRVVSSARGVHRRKSTTITGEQGLRSLGVVRYVMGMDLMSAVAWFLVYARVTGVRSASGFLSGYFEASRAKHPRTRDTEVIRHFRNGWLRLFSTKETRDSIGDTLRRK